MFYHKVMCPKFADTMANCVDHYELPRDKTNNVVVRPAKTQISLGIRPVWSVFAVRMKKAWVLSYPLSAQRRLWSDWADAQADPSLRWAHTHFVGFVTRWLIIRLLLLEVVNMRLFIVVNINKKSLQKIKVPLEMSFLMEKK